MTATETGAPDKKADAASRDDHSTQPDHAGLMREELRSVLASPDLSRAPIMKQLLRFLVEETAAGRGEQLKAYSVAVDGLGRPPDYDARADSYPRVQVGRLRKMLDSHYRLSGSASGVRLSIPSGRYKVVLETTEPGQMPGAATQDSPPAEPSSAVEGSMKAVSPLYFGPSLFLIVGLVLALGIGAARWFPMATAGAPLKRPVLEMAGVEMARQSNAGARIRTLLVNGLGRSVAFDLRPLPSASRTVGKGAPPPRYRLGADLIEGATPRLFLRLSQLSPDKLIWSGDLSLPADALNDGTALDQRLAPIIATIGKVDGLVAIHELQRSAGKEARGYSCLLLYHRYRKQRAVAERDHVQACVERSLAQDPDEAALHAAAAQLAVEKMSDPSVNREDRAGLLANARRHAQLARALDPYNGWINATQSRIALARGSCPQSANFALRAAALQPYDPNLLSEVGAYLADCRDTRAEPVIRRAITVGDDPSGRYHVPLLMLAIISDDREMAREALSQMAPPVIGRPRNFYVMTAAGYGMLGQAQNARAAWKQLERLDGTVAPAPLAYLERLGYSPATRRRIIRSLRAVGLPPA
jgi:hypothetical protein